MKKIFALFLLLSLCISMIAQESSPSNKQEIDSWKVTVNTMDPARREMISRMVEHIQSQGGDTRGVMEAVLLGAGKAGLTALIDVAATEIIRLATLKKAQKQEWIKMIEKECNYTDSLSSIKGLKDFYAEPSLLGALDPSHMNFDGISVTGMRDGHEVLHLSCRIDSTRLEHLYQHSKFCLVVDTIAFHPYECHLPNLSANGIHLKPGEKTERDNRFSYNEREHLTIGMELTLSSSWINEAITVQQNVELGRFNMSVTIPSGTEVYTYSRANIDHNRKLVADGIAPADAQLDTTYVSIKGDCFVVPRSYIMPIGNKGGLWGTGEYTMTVKFRESCRFSQDATHNEKMKHWAQDYRQLRKMQKQGSGFIRYWRTLWQQNGNSLMKTMIKSGFSSGVSEWEKTK